MVTPPSRQGAPAPERRAILDLGSNTAKLLVADATPEGLGAIHLEISVPCRLGWRLGETGLVADASLRRAVEVVGELLEAARAEGATRIAAVATSALRSARNGGEVARAIRATHGLDVEILTGEAEAEGVFRGVISDPFFRERAILIMDLGGGSAEWIEADAGRLRRKVSAEVGCVRMSERFLPEHPVRAGQRAALEAHLASVLRGPLEGFSAAGRTVVVTGGTACALATLRDPEFLEKARAGGREHFALGEAAAMVDGLAGMSLAAIEANPLVPPQRADVIVAGGITVVAVLRMLGAEGFYVSTRNLRYGRLLSMGADPCAR